VTEAALRDAYLAWTRRALPALVAPLALTAAVQASSASAWWTEGPPPDGAVRWLFIAVGVAAVATGRTLRDHDTRVLPLSGSQLRSLSWKLVVLALAPSFIGAILAMMTRSVLDYYLLLVATLVGVALLYPRFDQWTLWATAPDGRAE
jgi:hypothetical protein